MLRNRKRITSLRLIWALALGAVAATPAVAQKWPPTNTMVMIGAAAGTALDPPANIFTRAMAARTGTNFVLDHRGGAGGALAVAALANAEPTGSSIGLLTYPALVTVPMVTKVNYDSENDLIPVASVWTTPSVLMVSTRLGVKTMAETLDLIRKNPGKYNYSTALGIGSISHIGMDSVASFAQAKMTHVPFRSTADATQALLSGQVDFQVMVVGATGPLVQSGAAVPVAIIADSRHPAFPDVPTYAEIGIKDIPTSGWTGVFLPKGTPEPTVQAIRGHIKGILADPAIKEALTKTSFLPMDLPTADFATLISREKQVWRPYLSRLGLLLKDP